MAELQQGWAKSYGQIREQEALDASPLRRDHRWFLTFTGQRFVPDVLSSAPIVIEDIAHALSNICRFGGHTREFYSVAQHSVIVSMNVPAEHRLVALLHDATEAYVGDMIQPIKCRFQEFRDLEFDLWERIACEFGVSSRQPGNIPEIKEADCRALMTEKRDVMNPGLENWSWGVYDTYEPFLEQIIPISPREAELAFLTRFHALTA
jgi:5'-deoxynucleotidase YfbR-like HD superfamily hydrolase